MRSDERAVAGFFEDIPITLIVLAGVALIVSSSVWSSARMAEDDRLEGLHAAAQRAANRFVKEIREQSSAVGLPELKWIESINLTALLLPILAPLCFSMNVSLAGCQHWHVLVEEEGSTPATATGFAHEWFNAVTTEGAVVICEVRLIVWKA